MSHIVDSIWNRLNAAQIAILCFIAVILLGTTLLMLQVSNVGEPLFFVDALFTATSATCVTGLIVVDTSTKFTFFGQFVILLLIQVGGFGIMTISTLIIFIMGKHLSMKVSDTVGTSFLHLQQYTIGELTLRALLFTVLIELSGAVLLLSRFLYDYPLPKALWLAFFHSISAFCNAGFSLFPDNLIGYAGDPMVNFTIMSNIVLGGIGFVVLTDVWDRVCKKKIKGRAKLSFHTKIVLTVTIFLIMSGMILIYVIERGQNFAGMHPSKALMISLFQSVTARTAGFNTFDMAHLSNASLFVLIILMFIGGAPGSTAGGVKVTSFGVIMIVVISRLRRMGSPSMFGSSIKRKNLEGALTLVLLSTIFIVMIVMILLVTELGGTSHFESRGLTMEIFFESVSAFGTVGLSMGITPKLTVYAKLLISFVMFVGRLGPMTLLYAIERRKVHAFKYSEEEIIIG